MMPHQQKRVLIFLNPEDDPLGAGYHISQSKIAIGSGGLFGKGFLNGTQSHLDYLPEGHTDIVLATMTEAQGMVGGISLILAFILLLRWGLQAPPRSQAKFTRMTASVIPPTHFSYPTVHPI